jgi:two-component system, chemotaxis family, protein-glutamate methylesterase/glutaminase
LNPTTLQSPGLNFPASKTPLATKDTPIGVLICDDSAVIRGVIARTLESDPDLHVVARASNGEAALAALRPEIDVVILDIEMPGMDGMTALPLLLRKDPSLRVVMASTLTTRGADVALRALRLGAADYIPKPSAAEIGGAEHFRVELLAKVKGLARQRRRAAAAARPAVLPALPIAARAAPTRRPTLLAVGSSTGGPQALFTLFKGLGQHVVVPVVLTQHMPPSFTAMLAEHITKLGGMPCHEARTGEVLKPGVIHLAPGDRHLLIEESGGQFCAVLSDGPAENFCRPAVDPMLRSAAKAAHGRVLVVMLTGMGHDGLAGTQDVVAQGGSAIAQDEASSVVWGMPGAIAKAGLCQAILPLPAIAAKIQAILAGAPC